MSRIIDSEKLIERLDFYIECNPNFPNRISLKAIKLEIEEGRFDFNLVPKGNEEIAKTGYRLGLVNDETDLYKKDK